jgi:hypothetical protein
MDVNQTKTDDNQERMDVNLEEWGKKLNLFKQNWNPQ